MKIKKKKIVIHRLTAAYPPRQKNWTPLLANNGYKQQRGARYQPRPLPLFRSQSPPFPHFCDNRVPVYTRDPSKRNAIYTTPACSSSINNLAFLALIARARRTSYTHHAARITTRRSICLSVFLYPAAAHSGCLPFSHCLLGPARDAVLRL